MSRMNRGQMIDQALQRVGNNSNSLKWQARTRLNRILHDLHQGWDWPFLWTILLFDITPSGAVQFPNDTTFVKPEDNEAVVILSAYGQAMRQIVYEVDHQTLNRRIVETSGTVPRVWTMDYAQMIGIFWPRPTERCGAQMRYKFLPPDIAVDPVNDPNGAIYDASIPAFPWDSFLIDN